MENNKIVPCLWFRDDPAEAVALYTSIFKNSTIVGRSYYGASAAKASGRPEGSSLVTVFELAGQEFMALNGGPYFHFSQAISLFVGCDSEAEIDSLWAKLSAGGKVHLALSKYPFAEKYGWCEDKYGLSWQLILSKRRQKISPALLFVKDQVGKAEEAMKFYTSMFKNSEMEIMGRDEKTNAILHARFSLGGQEFVAMESPLKHDFEFTPAISFTVKCADQQEIDTFWEKLSADKNSEQCGWLKDKFGVSWQIVPRMMNSVMLGSDRQKAERVMAVVMKMKKLDLQEINKAAN